MVVGERIVLVQWIMCKCDFHTTVVKVNCIADNFCHCCLAMVCWRGVKFLIIYIVYGYSVLSDRNDQNDTQFFLKKEI